MSKKFERQVISVVKFTDDFLDDLSELPCMGDDVSRLGLALSVIMHRVYDLAPTVEDAQQLLLVADRMGFLASVDHDELEQDQNLDPADLPRVTSRTRAPKSGRSIVCPCCGVSSRVYHFAWSGLQCNTCKTMTPKHDWIVA